MQHHTGHVTQNPIQHLNPVFHGCAGTALQMRDAANVGADDDLEVHLLQIVELAVTQLVGNVGVEHRVGAGRATVQVRLVASDLDVEAQRADSVSKSIRD